MSKIKKGWTSLNKFRQYFKKKSSKDLYPTEPEIIVREINQIRQKIEVSWNHFLYAHADYVEIAIMEIYCYELEYGILSNKLRQLYGQKRNIRCAGFNTRDYLPWLANDNTQFNKPL